MTVDPDVVAFIEALDPQALTDADFDGLLAASGLVGAGDDGGLALPDRLAEVNALLDVASPAMREALLVAFLDRLSRPTGDRAGRPSRWRSRVPAAGIDVSPAGLAGCSASHAARARLPARASQASWTTSVSSSSESSPIREPRSSTDGWPSKCGVLKNGVDSSSTSACLSSSDSTQKTITSSYRSPVSGSTASGRGVRKKTKLRPPTW